MFSPGSSKMPRSLSGMKCAGYHLHLQWLCSCQVLVCLPVCGSLPIKDLAQLCSVPEIQLSRVLRLMATAGFLQVPQPGQIMHTYLPNLFVSQRLFRDATAFLAECCVPSALRIASTTHHQGGQQQALPDDTAYNLAFGASTTFHTACSLTPKLQRQWSAYLHCTGYFEDSITEVLIRLDWPNLGESCIVESGAQSTKRARVLSELYPSLRFIVQIAGRDLTDYDAGRSLAPRPASRRPSSRRPTTLALACRRDLLVRGSPSWTLRRTACTCRPRFRRASIAKDLRAYTRVLAANRGAILIVTARLLPPPGAVDRDLEAMARVRDLTLLQLANEREAEVAEFVDLVGQMGDSVGRLVVVDRLRARNNLTMALAVKYQEYGESGL